MMKTKFQMRYVTGRVGVQKSVTMRDIGMGVSKIPLFRFTYFLNGPTLVQKGLAGSVG